jgi:hypothetical protein
MRDARFPPPPGVRRTPPHWCRACGGRGDAYTIPWGLSWAGDCEACGGSCVDLKAYRSLRGKENPDHRRCGSSNRQKLDETFWDLFSKLSTTYLRVTNSFKRSQRSQKVPRGLTGKEYLERNGVKQSKQRSQKVPKGPEKC